MVADMYLEPPSEYRRQTLYAGIILLILLIAVAVI
jgi:hypothetical protein